METGGVFVPSPSTASNCYLPPLIRPAADDVMSCFVETSYANLRSHNLRSRTPMSIMQLVEFRKLSIAFSMWSRNLVLKSSAKTQTDHIFLKTKYQFSQ